MSTIEQAQNSMYEPIEHLKEFQWKPGQSGNPNGRPRGSVSTLLKEKDRQKVADKLYELVLEGKIDAIREFLDRTEGKVSSKLEIEGQIAIGTPEQLVEHARNKRIIETEEYKLIATD